MSVFSSLTDSPPPDAAIEIGADRISGASLDVRNGRFVVTARASEALPPGAVSPSLTSANVRDRGAAAAAVKRTLDQIGRPRRIGLVLPDAVAKVSIVRFEKVPPRSQDLDQLVRWQVRKTAPFPTEEAQLSFVQGFHSTEEGRAGQDFIITLARRDVVEEYESVCSAAGAYAGVVDIATFNVINVVLASSAAPSGDWLLINAAGDSASIAIIRGAHVIFFRSRGAESEGTLADLVHQTAMYHEDRLGGAGFSRVLLSGITQMRTPDGGTSDAARRTLAERLGAAVELLDPRSAVSIADPVSMTARALDELTPLAGVLLRDRIAGAAA
jgi:hypothetical protein